jgi:hypothetical protein
MGSVPTTLNPTHDEKHCLYPLKTPTLGAQWALEFPHTRRCPTLMINRESYTKPQWDTTSLLGECSLSKTRKYTCY